MLAFVLILFVLVGSLNCYSLLFLCKWLMQISVRT
ncbi:hypothetical protein TNIN_486251, partial [Trichonephila inaurata madagascariensis]